MSAFKLIPFTALQTASDMFRFGMEDSETSVMRLVNTTGVPIGTVQGIMYETYPDVSINQLTAIALALWPRDEQWLHRWQFCYRYAIDRQQHMLLDAVKEGSIPKLDKNKLDVMRDYADTVLAIYLNAIKRVCNIKTPDASTPKAATKDNPKRSSATKRPTPKSKKAKEGT